MSSSSKLVDSNKMVNKTVKSAKSKVNIAEGIDLTYTSLKRQSLKRVKSSLKQVPSLEAVEAEKRIGLESLLDVGLTQKSPLEVDLEIQRGRIMHILDTAIQKIEIAACLPLLLNNNAKILRRFLTSLEVDLITDVCSGYSDYPKPKFTAEQFINLANLNKVIDEISSGTMRKGITRKTSLLNIQIQSKVDPHMIRVAEILWANRCIKERYKTVFSRIDPVTKNFVQCLYNLKEATVNKFDVTAQEEREREKELRKAWAANKQAQEKIAELQAQLDKQRQEMGEQWRMKEEILDTYKNRINHLMATFKTNIKNRIKESERGMLEDAQASEMRQEELSYEAKMAQQQYHSLLEQHLAYEKNLRAKRFKVETQLASWIAKYDDDIGNRQAEFEEITKGYEEEKAEMEALQEKFDEQEEEYEILMAEKENEEMRIKEQIAMDFCRNRAARIIQIAWRAYRIRKKQKKKGKKGKGKGKGKKR